MNHRCIGSSPPYCKGKLTFYIYGFALGGRSPYRIMCESHFAELLSIVRSSLIIEITKEEYETAKILEE